MISWSCVELGRQRAVHPYDIEATQRLVRQLDRASDLIETACSAAALATLALDVHLEREGKDNHAQALLGTAHGLQLRLAELVELWRAIEES